jgi:hypothetical protein
MGKEREVRRKEGNGEGRNGEGKGSKEKGREWRKGR